MRLTVRSGHGPCLVRGVPVNGFARVADSLAQNGTSGHDPLHKPIIGRLVLGVNRTYFRAVDHIPALRRSFLNDLYTYRGADF